MTFKKDDIVKYVSGNYGDSPFNPLWNGSHGCIAGRITRITPFSSEDRTPIHILWDSNLTNCYNLRDLELVKKVTINIKELNQEYRKYDKISSRK